MLLLSFYRSCVEGYPHHPQHNVDPKNSGVDRAWNKYCQSTLYGGTGFKDLIHFSVCNDRDQFYRSCYPLAIFIPSTDSAIDVCSSCCKLDRNCSGSFVASTRDDSHSVLWLYVTARNTFSFQHAQGVSNEESEKGCRARCHSDHRS